MTRSTLPPDSEMPESTVSALHALYHKTAGAEPDPVLDKGILDAARAELRTDGMAKRKAPWWKGWVTAASAVVIAVVGLSVTWRVMDEQERRLREEIKAAEGGREDTAATAARATTAERAADASPAPDRAPPAVQKSRRAESAVVQDAPTGLPEPAKPSAAKAPTMAPAPVDEALNEGQSGGKDERRARRDAGATMEATPGSMRRMERLDSGSTDSDSGGKTATDALVKPSAGSSAKSLAVPAVDAASPEAWLKHIRELRAAGRRAEAAESLGRFRARYPDFVLPDDLIDVK